MLNQTHNYVVVVSKTINEATYQEIEAEIRGLLEKLGHLSEGASDA